MTNNNTAQTHQTHTWLIIISCYFQHTAGMEPWKMWPHSDNTTDTWRGTCLTQATDKKGCSDYGPKQVQDLIYSMTSLIPFCVQWRQGSSAFTQQSGLWQLFLGSFQNVFPKFVLPCYIYTVKSPSLPVMWITQSNISFDYFIQPLSF